MMQLIIIIIVRLVGKSETEVRLREYIIIVLGGESVSQRFPTSMRLQQLYTVVLQARRLLSKLKIDQLSTIKIFRYFHFFPLLPK